MSLQPAYACKKHHIPPNWTINKKKIIPTAILKTMPMGISVDKIDIITRTTPPIKDIFPQQQKASFNLWDFDALKTAKTVTAINEIADATVNIGKVKLITISPPAAKI